MLTEYSIMNEIAYEVKQGFNLHLTSSQIGERLEAYYARKLYTLPTRTCKGGLPRYRKGFMRSLRSAAAAMRNLQEGEKTIFGYEYKGEFYTTYKGKHDLTKKYNLKTTEVLLKLKLTMEEWDSLPRGAYYPDTLTQYYGSQSFIR